MRKTVLFLSLELLVSLIWSGRSAVCATPAPEVLGQEVDGLQVSIRLNKTGFATGEPIVVDLQITNVLSVAGGKEQDRYIPWVLSAPHRLCEIHAVDANDINHVIWDGAMGGLIEVLRLTPGHFCGYRLTCGSKGVGRRKDLEPGKYHVYAHFENWHKKVPGPPVNIDIRQLPPDELMELVKGLVAAMKRIEKENEKLGEHSFWVGQAFSESITIEVVGQ